MKLQLYVLRQLVVSLAFSVGGLLLVALPGIAVRTAHEIPSAKAVHLAQFLAISLQNLVPYVLPICFLLATVATYGRLAADKEWIAIQMAGVRPAKLLLPALLVGVLLGLFAYVLLSLILPDGKTRQRDLVIEVTSSALTNLGPGGTSLSFEDGRVVLEALAFDEETGLMHEVFLRTGDASESADYHAARARIRIVGNELRAELFEFIKVQRTETSLEYFETEGIEIRRVLERKEHERRPRYMPSYELIGHIRDGTVPKGKLLRYRFEVHYRLALSAVFLIFALLGPAAGLLARRGTQLGALSIASGYALLHYLLQMQVSKSLGTSGAIDPALAAWSPIAIGALGAIFMLRKALRR